MSTEMIVFHVAKRNVYENSLNSGFYG